MDAVECETCRGCGARLAIVDGAIHPYMTSSPGCWRRYGEVLAAQYASPPRMAFQQLVVDAYAVQHPGGEDPRAVQSVAIHLMTLGMFIEQDTDPALGTRLHRRMLQRPVFYRLDPPAARGALTVLDVPLNAGADQVRLHAYAWGQEAWRAWETHHATVRGWLTGSGLGG